MTTKAAVAITAGAIVAAFIAGYFAPHKKAAVERVILRRDTLTIRDTIIERAPREVATITLHDTLRLATFDTLTIRDTLYIEVERQQRIYQDSAYCAWVSGYQPQLDSLHIYAQHQIVTQPPARWSFGVTAGYAVTPSGMQPYIGAGLCYSLFSF